jgi:hypothetical protein
MSNLRFVQYVDYQAAAKRKKVKPCSMEALKEAVRRSTVPVKRYPLGLTTVSKKEPEDVPPI